MRLRLSEQEKARIQKNYAALYAKGDRSSPTPHRWEYILIEVLLVLSGIQKAFGKVFGYYRIDI